MANEKIVNIEKLSDDSLENIAGGGRFLKQNTCDGLQLGGGIAAAAGCLGFAACTIAGNICELKGKKAAKGLFIARDMFMGVTALGGGVYTLGKVG